MFSFAIQHHHHFNYKLKSSNQRQSLLTFVNNAPWNLVNPIFANLHIGIGKFHLNLLIFQRIPPELPNLHLNHLFLLLRNPIPAIQPSKNNNSSTRLDITGISDIHSPSLVCSSCFFIKLRKLSAWVFQSNFNLAIHNIILKFGFDYGGFGVFRVVLGE